MVNLEFVFIALILAWLRSIVSRPQRGDRFHSIPQKSYVWKTRTNIYTINDIDLQDEHCSILTNHYKSDKSIMWTFMA